MKITIPMRSLKNIVEALNSLKLGQIDLNSDRDVTRKEALTYLLPQLMRLKAKGHPVSELALALSEHDLPITANALGRHLSVQNGRKKATTEEAPEENPSLEIAPEITDELALESSSEPAAEESALEHEPATAAHEWPADEDAGAASLASSGSLSE